MIKSSIMIVFKILLFLGLGVRVIITTSDKPFENACELHSKLSNSSSKHVSNSPAQMLPEEASLGWQYATEPDIKMWYEIGKAECNSYLESKRHFFGKNFPDPYLDSKNIPAQGQKQCRGTDMLYSLAGIIVWPFGPLKDCPSYKKCWFGLLTCGEKNSQTLNSLGKNQILKALLVNEKDASLPAMGDWSIRALRIHLRIVGLEIIVPEQRFMSIISRKTKEDVLIAQYTITLPYNDYRLEMRQEELYPSALYKWNKQQVDKYGMEIPGNVYLGGSESRCKPWTGPCQIKNMCCGCDERSFVIGTPINVTSKDGSDQCPNIQKMKQDENSVLPICPSMSSAG
jgi:hypothetical protein